MKRYFIAIMLVLLVTTNAWADMPGTTSGSVGVHKAKQSGTVIDASNPISVTTATKYTDKIDISRTSILSVELTVDTTATMSIAVTVQGSNDGTNFKDFDSAVTITTLTADYDKIIDFAVPVCKYIRIGFASDASDVGYDVDKVWVTAW